MDAIGGAGLFRDGKVAFFFPFPPQSKGVFVVSFFFCVHPSLRRFSLLFVVSLEVLFSFEQLFLAL